MILIKLVTLSVYRRLMRRQPADVLSAIPVPPKLGQSGWGMIRVRLRLR